MTVASQISKRSHQIEYILCIEGIGWPVDEYDLSSGLDGDYFVTADLAGDLNSQMQSGTPRFGLELPRSIGDRFDPETNDYSSGGLGFSVVDVDDILKTLIRPLRPSDNDSGNNTLFGLSESLARDSDTVKLTASVVGTSVVPSAQDVVWLGGREAVKLGSRSGPSGGVYTYSSCTRGHLGTPRGSFDPRGVGTGQFAFKTGTLAYLENPFWHDRRILLFLHVPGESSANLVRIYTGRLRNLVRASHGAVWEFQSVAEKFGGVSRYYEPFRNWRVKENSFSNQQYGQLAATNNPGAGTLQDWQEIPTTQVETARRVVTIDVDGDDVDSYDEIGLAIMYAYRTVPGGTAGAVGQISSGFTAPQTETESISTHPHESDTKEMISGIVKIGDRYSRALWKKPNDTSGNADPGMNRIVLEGVTPELGNRFRGFFEDGEPVKLCLDNREQSSTYNRFTVNGEVRSNIIDILLMFLTTMPNEFEIFDATSGGDVDAVNNSAASWSTNEWAGYAIHCVEGPNKGESRVIVSNTSTQIVPDVDFSSASHSGNEYQIRNSIYDVLPLGWGLGIPNERIDLDTFEDIRERYVSDCHVGQFVIGDADEISIWDTLVRNIMQPYGIMPYIDRGTGKLSARWMGSILDDGIEESYLAIGNTEILPGSFEEFDMMPRVPMSHIRLLTRGEFSWGVPATQSASGGSTSGAPWQTGLGSGGSSGNNRFNNYDSGTAIVPNLDGDPDVVNIRQQEIRQHYARSDLGTLEVEAMFNSIRNSAPLQSLLLARLLRQASPPPETTLNLDIKHVTSVQAGTILSVTASSFNVPDPYDRATSAAGLSTSYSGQLCRVLSSSIVLSRSQPKVECRVQVLEAINAAKIAPAVVVTAKGGTGGEGDPYYFTVGGGSTFDEYINQPPSEYDYLDWTGLKVGDKIELRSQSGALVEGSWAIESFGFNEAATTEDALSAQINVDSSISNTSWSGTYVTFAPWDQGNNSSNMEGFAAFADSTNEDIDGDDAKEWA